MKKVPRKYYVRMLFYLRPVAKVSDAPESMWYTSVAVGKKHAAEDVTNDV